MSHVEVSLRHTTLRNGNAMLKLCRKYIELKIHVERNILTLLIHYNHIDKN